MRYHHGGRRRPGLLVRAGAVPALALAIALGGCGGESPDNDRARSYGHDGYLGLSNSNPNVFNRHTYWNYGSDAALVRQTLSGVEGVRTVRVMFNPPWLEVRVRTEPGLTAEEKAAVIAQAQAITEANFAYRYRVKVRQSG